MRKTFLSLATADYVNDCKLSPFSTILAPVIPAVIHPIKRYHNLFNMEFGIVPGAS